MTDSFETLGLPSDATEEQVRAAYRKLAFSDHPDHGGDDSRFARLTWAYRAALKTFEVCSMCGGKGRVARQEGFIQMHLTCTTCGGTGKRNIKK